MAAPTFDLQSHSVHSDGALAPADVVAAAADAGVELLALSDHDTSAGVLEARAAARAVGIGLIDATEITTTHDGRQDIHILGYLIDPEHPPLVAALAHSRGDRERRAERMAARLRELGYELDEATLRARTAQGKTIGRPHLAQAATSHPANEERLRSEGLLDPTKFLVAYLIEGKPAFVDREAPSVAEAVELIHDAGGVAVWAHPFWDIPEIAEVRATLDAFRGYGIDGVEAFYPSFSERQVRFLVRTCAEHGLLTTGSSDFHGPGHHTFSRFRAFELHGLEPNLGPLGRADAGP
ncbi:MAG TPA: PHP domain-containing protein [Solirubrobacteraceae bacterium]|nr:PHP domain-containing protein [Solirubrobacteraceae bacterium]